MAADAGIYGMIRQPRAAAGPLEEFGQTLQLKSLMDSQGLAALQRQQLETSMAEDQAVKDFYSRLGTANPRERIGDLLRVSPKAGMAAQKFYQESDKNEAELKAKQMETFVKGVGVLKDRLPTVRDEASYAAYVETAKSILGPEAVTKLNLPPTYDPNWVKGQLVKAEELFTPKPTRIEKPGGGVEIIDMNPFTNPKAVGMNWAAAMTPAEKDASARGWANVSLVAQKANRPTWDSERGAFVTNPVQVGVPRMGGSVMAGPSMAAAATPGARPAAGGAPAGVGPVAPRPGAPAAVVTPPGLPPAKLTETQGKASGFGMRAAEANRILTELENAGQTNTGIAKSVVSGIAGMVPFVGDRMESAANSGMNTLPEFLGGPSGAQQRVEQARRDFVNAVLRMESGAVISPQEFDNASRQYFPQPGDSESVIEQKRRNRETAIKALEVQAGPGGRNVKPQQPAQQAPQAGGIRFIGFE